MSGGGDSRGIGTDQWVEQNAQRTARGTLGAVRARIAAIPPTVRILSVAALALLWAVVSPTDYTSRLAFLTALYTLLACGLNVVVGWAGLLDLSYTAFFGFGAYMFALLASDKFDLHWPTIVLVPCVILATAALGVLIGLPSRRLSGDYLAIVTLFFGQIFVSLVNNGDRLQLTFGETSVPSKPFNLTGGPNGVTGIEPWSIFGHAVRGITGYYVLTVVVTTVVMILLTRLRRARPGLALRAMREDALAADVLSIPVRRLRLVAFAVGAGIAGLAGTIFSAVQQSVFGSNFDMPFLVLMYAAVILGGLGSLGGGLLGAALVAIVPELLRTPSTGRLLVYATIVVLAASRFRRRTALAWFAAGLVGAAVLFRLGLSVTGTTLAPRSGGLAGVTRALVPLLSTPDSFGNTVFLLTIAGGLAITVIPARWRPLLGGVVAYVAMLAWENRLAEQPSITRQLLVGAVLVGVMASRPHGFFGTKRVEVM